MNLKVLSVTEVVGFRKLRNAPSAGGGIETRLQSSNMHESLYIILGASGALGVLVHVKGAFFRRKKVYQAADGSGTVSTTSMGSAQRKMRFDKSIL